MGRVRFLLVEVLPSALLIILLLRIKFRRNTRQFLAYASFAVYLSAVYALTGLPTVLFVRFDPSVSLIPFAGMMNDLKNAILNVLLFLPLGFLLPLLWQTYRDFRKTLCFGFALTLCIELLQIFTFRATDINDIITNTLGTCLGFLTAALFLRKRPVQTGNELRDCFFLIGMTAAVMFFVQPLISSAIWKYVL